MSKNIDIFEEMEKEVKNIYSNSMFIGDLMPILETYKRDFYDISKRCFLTFSTRDTEIFRARYLNVASKKITFREISLDYSITRERVEQIVKACLANTKKQLINEMEKKETMSYLNLPVSRFFCNNTSLDEEELDVSINSFINCNYEVLPLYDKKKINSILMKIYKSLKRNFMNLGFSDYDYIRLIDIFKSNLSNKPILDLNISNVTYCRLLSIGISDIYSLLEVQMEYLCSNGLLTNSDLSSIYNCFGEKVDAITNIAYIDKSKKLKYLYNLDISNINLSFKTSCVLKTFDIRTLGTIIDSSNNELIRKYGLSESTINELRNTVALLTGDIDDTSAETKIKVDYQKKSLKDVDLPYSIYKKLIKNGKRSLYDVLICSDEELNEIGEDVYHSVKLLSFKIDEDFDTFSYEFDSLNLDDAYELLNKYEYEKNKIEEQILLLKSKEDKLDDRILKLNSVIKKKVKK